MKAAYPGVKLLATASVMVYVFLTRPDGLCHSLAPTNNICSCSATVGMYSHSTHSWEAKLKGELDDWCC